MLQVRSEGRGWRIPDRHVDYRYTLALHGVGMADEWPCIPLHVDYSNRAMSGRFKPGMVLCVESPMAKIDPELTSPLFE